MGLPSDSDVDAYIAQQATRLGINPNVAVSVSHAERQNRSSGWIGDQETSFGPFMLHYGGGLGDVFTQKTGLNARDIANTWKQQVDFSLTWARDVSGWEPFHAAAKLGYGTWDGIRTSVGNMAQAFSYFFPLVGYTADPKKTYHTPGATDLFAPKGTPIRDVADGRVTVTSSSGPGGNSVVVHGLDGLDYYYAHMDAPTPLHPGDYVAGGQIIGNVGNTGNAAGKDPHLHIGIGHGIESGVGANGGTGRNFDAQTFLASILTGGGADATTHGVLVGVGNDLLTGDPAGDIKAGLKGAGSDLIQQFQNYIQDRSASIVFLTLGILLLLAGIWGFAMQSDTVKSVVKVAGSQVGGIAGVALAAA